MANRPTSARHAAAKTSQTSTIEGEQHAASNGTLHGVTEKNHQSRVRVSGVRRVWGTHWSSSPKAMVNTIRKFCGITPNRVKRKYTKNNVGRLTRWWFVIHDSEEVLANIDSKWDQLKLQVAWELEPWFVSQRQSNPALGQVNGPANVDTHQDSPRKVTITSIT